MAANPASILITGASSGIGRALAEAYAAEGVQLALSGRSADRLESVAGACRDLGAQVQAKIIDVGQTEAMANWIAEIDRAAPVDLVVANAGVSAGTLLDRTGGAIRESEITGDSMREMFRVNVNGVFNTVLPVLPVMQERRRGQIAIVSSIAGYRGLPSSPAYAASKAAVKSWGEGLRPLLGPCGVGVTVICPGFVESRITSQNPFPMPFLMDAQRAARIIRRGLERNQARITFPWPMAIGAWLAAALPPALVDGVLARLPRKE